MPRMRGWTAWYPYQIAIFASHHIGYSFLPERVGRQQLRQPLLLAVTCETGTTAALRH